MLITFDGSEAYQPCSQTSPRHGIAQRPAPHRNHRPWVTRPCDTTDIGYLGIKYGSTTTTTTTTTLFSDCHARPLKPLEEPASSPWNYIPANSHQTWGAAAIVDHSTPISSLVLDSEQDDSISHVQPRGFDPAPGGAVYLQRQRFVSSNDESSATSSFTLAFLPRHYDMDVTMVMVCSVYQR